MFRVVLLIALLFCCVGLLEGRETPQEKPASVVVRLPASAELYVEKVKTKQTGPVREFETPPLKPGKTFSYHLKATWTDMGKEVVREAVLRVRAGETAEVDLTQPPAEVVKTDKPAEKIEKPGGETSKGETPKAELPKGETPKEKKVKVEPPKGEGPKLDPPEPPKKEGPSPLKLELPERVEVETGGTKTLTVKLARADHGGPVMLTFQGWRSGPPPEPVVVPAGCDEAGVNLRLPADAAAGAFPLTVTAVGDGARAQAAVYILARKPAPVPLRLQMPESLVVQAGATRLLPVRVFRTDFAGPVELSASGLPPGLTLRGATVPADKDRGYLAAVVDADAAAGKYTIKVRAKASQGSAEGQLTLEITK
jgi:uncharacterized protein (TIGR03000 family)